MIRYTLRQLEYFVAVGDSGSIARASERINVSSPSISAAIAQLEQEFGLPLFVRQHAHGLSLTQAGRQMLDQARLVLREADALMDTAGDIAGTVRGPLSVGCLVTFAQIIVPSLRHAFEAKNPDVRLRQHELNQLDIFSGLRRSEIDLAITYDLDLPADLQFEGLVELPPFAVVGAEHALAGRDQVTAIDLVDHPMVLLDLPLSSDYFLSLFEPLGVKPQIVERTRDMAVMRSLVANGFGFSIANVRPINPLSPDGKPLKFIPIAGSVRALRMGLLIAQDASKSNAVRAFLEHCRAAVKEGALPGLSGPT